MRNDKYCCRSDIVIIRFWQFVVRNIAKNQEIQTKNLKHKLLKQFHMNE